MTRTADSGDHLADYTMPTRRIHIALVAIPGVLLIVLAVFSSGKGVAYVIGAAALAAAATMVVAAVARRRRRLVIGGAALVAAGCVAIAVAVPRAMLSDDRLVALETTGDVFEAASVGDVIVLRVQDEGGGVEIVVADAMTGRELGRHPTSLRAEFFAGRGSVAAIETNDARVTAIGVDGTELWSADLDDELSGSVPIALQADGTLVLQRPRDDEWRQQLVAVDADGDERWRQDVPFDIRVGNDTFGSPRSLPTRVIAIRQNPVRAGTRSILAVNIETGEFEEAARADRALVGVGFVALLDEAEDSDECALTFLGDDLEPQAESEYDCAGTTAMLAFGNLVEITNEESAFAYVDATSGAFEQFEPGARPPIPTASALVSDPREILRIGADPIVAPADDWTLTATANLDTVRLIHAVDSHNPVRPSEQFEVVLVDLDTGERCARARFDGGSESLGGIDTQGLPGCRAIVEIDGELALVAEEES